MKCIKSHSSFICLCFSGKARHTRGLCCLKIQSCTHVFRQKTSHQPPIWFKNSSAKNNKTKTRVEILGSTCPAFHPLPSSPQPSKKNPTCVWHPLVQWAVLFEELPLHENLQGAMVVKLSMSKKKVVDWATHLKNTLHKLGESFSKGSGWKLKNMLKIPLHVMNEEYITTIYRQKKGVGMVKTGNQRGNSTGAILADVLYMSRRSCCWLYTTISEPFL